MKKLLPPALVIATTCLAVSCKDEKTPQPTQYDNYTQLKVGNYWIYQIFDVDSFGQGPPLNEYDSCYISKDTLINGNTYYYLSIASVILFEDNTYNKWLRDSLHYLVDNEGAIHFSSEDFTNTFSTSILTLGIDTLIRTKKMESKDAFLTTPAGNFITSDFKTTIKSSPQAAPQLRRYGHRRYAKDVGVVSETRPFFIADIRYKERRLLRYHLN